MVLLALVGPVLGSCSSDTSGQGCIADGECDPGEVCHAGACRPQRECYADNYCPVGKACDTETGVCVVAGAGHVGASCKPGRSTCVHGSCFGLYPGDDQAFCTGDCRTDRDCPKEYRCVVPETGTMACFPMAGPKGEKDRGQSCDRANNGHRDCKPGLYCHPQSAGRGTDFCVAGCRSSSECRKGWSCRGPYYTQKVCLPGMANGETGADCHENEEGDCKAGYHCVWVSSNSMICTVPCRINPEDPCPAGFACLPTSYEGDGGRYCLPASGGKTGELGEPCPKGVGDCKTGACVQDANLKTMCTRRCADAADCPSDYPCQPHSSLSKDRYCLPKGFKPPV